MEQIKLNLEKVEGNELIIRTGEAVKVLDPKEPKIINISGVLSSPFDWLEKRCLVVGCTDQSGKNLIDGIPVDDCHLIVDREKMEITLKIDENDHYQSTINGKLSIHPKFKEFGINTGSLSEPKAMGDFFKMNRTFFKSLQNNKEVVAALKNLNIRTKQAIQKANNDRGSIDASFKQEVTESNLPESFVLNIPIFKGFPAQEIEVEVYAHIDGTTTLLSLVSPGANEIIEEFRDRCITEVVENIKALVPSLVIIEI